MMKKGIVMDLIGRSAIIMTPSGEFIQINNSKSHWQVGDEILFQPKSSSPNLVYFMRYTAAVAAVFLLFTIGLPWMQIGTPQAVAAYVTFDMNPSLELSISQKEEIMGVTALNEEGERLISDLDLIGEDLSKATALIVAEAERQGFLTEIDANVVVATVVLDQATISETELRLNITRALTKRSIASGKKMNATLLQATQQIREEANENHVSVGEYAIYLTAKEQGIDIDIDSFKKLSIREIVKSNKGLQVILGTQVDMKKEQSTPSAIASPGDSPSSQSRKKGDSEGTKRDGKPEKPDKDKKDKSNKNDNREDRNKVTVPSIAKIPGFQLKLPSFDDHPGKKKGKHRDRDDEDEDREDEDDEDEDSEAKEKEKEKGKRKRDDN